RWVDADPVFAIAGGPDERLDLGELGPALVERRAPWQLGRRIAAGDIGQNALALLIIEPRSLGEVAALVLAAGTEQEAHALPPDLVELVDRPQHGEPAASLGVAGKPDRLHHPVEDFSVVDPDDIGAAGYAEALHGVGGHHADLGIGRDRGRADRVGVELHEL